jgi:ATP-dependent DNA helicase RecG
VNVNEVKELLADLESDRAERTISTTDTNKFAEAICSFSNDLPNHQEPGYLFIGVTNNGLPSGVDVSDQLLQNLAAIRSDGNVQPLPRMNVERMLIDETPVAVVEVFPSDLPPVRYKGRVHIRVGPRRGIASEAEERALSERRAYTLRTWDARPCLEATIDDLQLDVFLTTYRSAAVDRRVIEENDRPIELQLAALRCYDLKAQRPTNAGVLLFGKDPQSFYTGAYVQTVRYAGTDSATEVQHERRITGDFLTMLRALDEVAEDRADAKPVATSSTAETIVYAYPPKAMHELLVNAIIHRNYEGGTTPVQFNEYTDRIEILNPGGLYPDLTPESFSQMTAYRNPVLAEAAKVLGFANRFGRGIALAKSELARNGSPEPQFTFQPNFFMVTVPRRK